MKEKIIRIAVMAALLSIVLIRANVYADDTDSFDNSAPTYSGYVQELDADVKAYTEPKDDAEVGAEFSKGGSVYITGEADGYYSIFYQGEELYIKTDDISSAARDKSNENNKAIEEEAGKELEANEKMDVTYVESFERQLDSARNALIWKIVIGVLVVAFIAVSVIIAVRNNKQEEAKEETKEEEHKEEAKSDNKKDDNT